MVRLDKLKVARAKELRGEIICRLYAYYDKVTPVSSINALLRYRNYNSKEDIKKALHYLSGAKKEFIHVTINEDDYFASFVQLTPTGINLAEGDISDIGVIMNG